MCDTRGEKGDNWYYSIYRGDHELIPNNDRENHTEQLQYTGFSGEYQCRAHIKGSTKASNKVSLTVSDKDVILETPASSLFEGESVTLGCRHRDPTKNKNAVFYKDGSAVEMDTNLQSQMMKNTVQVISDRSSSYMCKFGDEESEPIKLKTEPQPKAHLMDFPAEGNVTLSCSVTSSSSSGWKFFWYKGEKTSEPLTKQDAVLLSSGQITVSRGGVYWCRGGRGEPLYYTEYSHSVVTNRAVVSLQPNWPEIYSGETITLTCEIEDGGDTEWEYEWRTSSSTTPPKTREYTFKPSSGEDFWCLGVIKGGESSTKLSDVFTLTPSYNKPEPVLTVSPSWLSPGDSVTLNCRVKHPSAGWRFSWYKAVPKPSDNSYSYELLPDSTTGTEQDSYIVHGQTHTAGYVCRAGRGDPVYHTDYSQPQFVWSGDFGSSASLTVSPDRVQHFTSDSVSLSCEGNSTEWRVKRFTDGSHLRDCSISSWGTMTGPTCQMAEHWPSGVYWCESGTGEFSNAVNITLTYENIILLSPVSPVTEGRSVTLGCKLKTQNDIYNVVFYKNGKIIQNDTRKLIISAVSKSDEGFYKCKGDNSPQGWSVTSPESWMSVKSASRPENNPPFPVLLVVGLVGGVLLIILLLLFLLLCCYRKSKDSCFNRSQRSNQSPATDQDGSQHTGCASTLQGDVCHYESIKDTHETENGDVCHYESIKDTHETENDKSRDATYSVIELKNMRKDDEAHQNALYSTVEMASAADDNLTYAQVHTKMNAEKGK
ncbi:Fc receptor-like protein 4 [Centropristis striata]|uniref:Fc receptor-like protein 4 n=1 Tax=Centropristis striata TaxID=184440 RepID=UPI0027DEF40D|nr:Fc receptor-like protein 4 [Centropristis striata]